MHGKFPFIAVDYIIDYAHHFFVDVGGFGLKAKIPKRDILPCVEIAHTLPDAVHGNDETFGAENFDN